MSNVSYYLQAEQGIPAGSAYALNKAVVHFGTDPRNDVVFAALDIGNFHATIQWATNGFQIVDRNSGMLTTINGRRLAPATPHLLSHGDYIQLGQQVAFRFMMHPPPHQSVVTPPIVQPTPQPVVPAPAPPPDTSSAYLTDKSRIGCHFCFYTLDPNDPNPAMRQFVKAGQHHYHVACYDMLPAQTRPPATPVQIRQPNELVWVWRVPIILE